MGLDDDQDGIEISVEELHKMFAMPEEEYEIDLDDFKNELLRLQYERLLREERDAEIDDLAEKMRSALEDEDPE